MYRKPFEFRNLNKDQNVMFFKIGIFTNIKDTAWLVTGAKVLC